MEAWARVCAGVTRAAPAEGTTNAVSRRTIRAVRTIRSVRRIESITSVRRLRSELECLGGFGFV
jgi:hypothetical protein